MSSHTISIDILRNRDAVYGFMSQPANVPRWAPVTGRHEQTGRHRWRSEFERGTFEIEFSPENEFGVLDYSMMHSVSGAVQTFAMRVVPSPAGSVLMLTLFRREGATDEQFRSEIEWTTSDLLVLKVLLESIVDAG